MKAACLVILLLLVSAPFSGVEASSNLATELRQAQKALAAGEYEAAFTEYHHYAAEKGNPLAQFSVALFYENGWGRSVNRAEACLWYEKAAAADIPAAVHFAAECIEQGVHLPAAPTEAATLYRRAVDLGHVASLCSLGRLYMTGNGVEKDPANGLQLCIDYAAQGPPSSQVQVGKYLLEGEASIRNPAKAKEWFQAAAQKGSLEAQYYLGVMHRDGNGVQQDLSRALGWFESAAGQGFANAYLPTGELYFGDPNDELFPSETALAKAYLWLTAAAKSNKDQQRAARLLQKVREIMPASWVQTLDEKVQAHLASYPVSER